LTFNLPLVTRLETNDELDYCDDDEVALIIR